MKGLKLSWPERIDKMEGPASELVFLLEKEVDFPELVAEVNEQLENLKQQNFKVMVVGEFNRGKSTFLNAMLGCDCFPTNILPNTAVVTRVVYSEEPRAIVFFRDGGRKELSLEDFRNEYSLSTEDLKYDPGHAEDRFSKVDYIELGYPLELCRQNVILIDTPGLNEDLRRTLRVLRHLDETDAVIFLLWVPQLFSELEQYIVEKYLQPAGLKKIFFLLNGWNLITSMTEEDDIPRQQQELSERARIRLSSYVPEDEWDSTVFQLDAVSAEKGRLASPPDEALVNRSGLAKVEEALGEFLTGGREQVLLDRARYRLPQLKEQVLGYLDLQLHDLSLPVEEIKDTLEEYRAGLVSLEMLAYDLTDYLEENIEADASEFVREAEEFSYQVADSLVETAEKFNTPEKEKPVGQAIDNLRKLIEKHIDEKLTGWLITKKTWLENLPGGYRSKAGECFDQFMQRANEITGVDAAGLPVPAIEVDWQGLFIKCKTRWMEAFLSDWLIFNSVDLKLAAEDFLTKLPEPVRNQISKFLPESLAEMKDLISQTLLSGVSPHLEAINASLRNLEAVNDKLAVRSENDAVLSAGKRKKIKVLKEKVKDIFTSLESCLD